MRLPSLLALVTVALATAVATAAPRKKATAAEKEAEAFLETITSLLIPVSTVAAEADWAAATDVTPEHTGLRTGADKALATLSGSTVIITRAKAFLARKKDLDEITVRQLEKLLLGAAENPGTIPEVVGKRVEAEARQSNILDGYTFCLQPKPGAAGGCAVTGTANQIDDVLRKSRDLAERQRIWIASKEIGRPLKPGLVELRELRNQVAKEMGYSSYFALQVADYGMTVDEMMKLLDATLETTRPLYDQLHCWAKNTLAARFKRPAPRLIPAHWIGNRWAQQWPGLIEEANLDPLFKGSSAETIVKSAENFYVSLGFPRLPESFWKKSDLYPVAPGSARKKNSHASAWHLDRAADVRSLMSVEPDEQWFATAHHELGHIYYYISYSTPAVPMLLREGANRAFHEAVGELAKLASQETPYLIKVGVMPRGKEPDATSWLLESALESIVFLPFSAGTMSHFERDLYETNLAPADWQKKWWEYATQYQGIVPPAPRADDLCDACTKTHINDDAAQYYDYALASLIKFQLHDHICTRILQQDVRACDYSGSQPVGDFLRGILKLGATRDWRAVIKDATGEPISPRAMMAFYQPLVDELGKRNAGKDCGR
ncbi:MAG TPA: M2 family metallopeptidase [Polyangia bacterium]|nr:M2 family metallopeptidase [Polyangia bacterium]